ncbi:MAG TPA: flagellin [Candidatus Binatia bacterium]|jgi:flagellin
MPIIINTNLASLQTQRNLTNANEALSRSMERLASGLRINRASDDAAGMGIALRMTGQIRSLSQAARNTMDGISLIQVAEGAYNEVANILVRLRELAIQSANGTLSTADRATLQVAADRLIQEISGIATSTQFNGVTLLNNSAGNTIVFQVGVGTVSYTVAATDQIAVTLYSLAASSFTSSNVDLTSGANQIILTSASNALAAIATLDTVITNLNQSRSVLGAAQNGLESRSRNQTITIENLTAARSRIQDVDVAQETSEMVRGQILVQTGTSVLAQANQLPSLALTLLGGGGR